MDASDPTIVFTGYTAFADASDNPSRHVARAAAEAIGAASVELPVTFEEARRAGEIDARHVVHFGVAAKRPFVAIERRAVNRCGDDVGVDGQRPSTILEVDGPEVVMSEFDVDALQRALSAAWDREPVAVSDDAGAYVCNATLYHAARRDPQRIFVHVPDWTPAEAEAFGRVFGPIYARLVGAAV